MIEAKEEAERLAALEATYKLVRDFVKNHERVIFHSEEIRSYDGKIKSPHSGYYDSDEFPYGWHNVDIDPTVGLKWTPRYIPSGYYDDKKAVCEYDKEFILSSEELQKVLAEVGYDIEEYGDRANCHKWYHHNIRCTSKAFESESDSDSDSE